MLYCNIDIYVELRTHVQLTHPNKTVAKSAGKALSQELLSENDENVDDSS